MKQIIIYFLAFFVFCSIGAQVPKSELNSSSFQFEPEEAFLSTNSSIFLTGETINYKTFNLLKKNKQSSSISKIMYVELVGINGEVIFKHKLKLKNGSANSDFFIPSTLKTNNYKLIAYTNWSLNNESKPFYELDLYIINPYLNPTTELSISSSNSVAEIELQNMSPNEPISKKSNNIDLTLSKSTYNTRDKVILKIDKHIDGNYSLSVRKLDDVKVSIPFEESLLSIKPSEVYLPEFRGEIISGKIIPVNPSDNTPINNINVSISFPSNTNFLYKNVKTNSEGRFIFNIHENYFDSNTIIQINEDNSSEYKIEMDKFKIDYNKHLSFKTVNLNENIEEWLVKRSIHSQVENAYFNKKNDSIKSKSSLGLFYDSIAKKYLLSDYTKFKSVRETFIEIIQDVAIIKENDIPKFKIIYPSKSTTLRALTNLEPLVLFDGVLIKNMQNIIEVPIKEIKSIDVITDPYFYGSDLYSGLVSFKSVKGNLDALLIGQSTMEIEIKEPQMAKIFYQPNYIGEDLKNIPDYRNQLYWNPSIDLSSSSQWEFYTSDNTGVFEVILEGYTNDGNYVISKEYFKVIKE